MSSLLGTVVVFNEYNISRHFSTKHANYTSNQSMQEWAGKLKAALVAVVVRVLYTLHLHMLYTCYRSHYIILHYIL